MLAKISQLIFANTGSHFVPIGSYRDARQVAGCLSDLYLRALRVLRGSNLAFLCAPRPPCEQGEAGGSVSPWLVNAYFQLWHLQYAELKE